MIFGYSYLLDFVHLNLSELCSLGHLISSSSSSQCSGPKFHSGQVNCMPVSWKQQIFFCPSLLILRTDLFWLLKPTDQRQPETQMQCKKVRCDKMIYKKYIFVHSDDQDINISDIFGLYP